MAQTSFFFFFNFKYLYLVKFDHPPLYCHLIVSCLSLSPQLSWLRCLQHTNQLRFLLQIWTSTTTTTILAQLWYLNGWTSKHSHPVPLQPSQRLGSANIKRKVCHTSLEFPRVHILMCIQDEPAPTMQLQDSLLILSATELKKPISRQEPKGASFTLTSDEPWGTLKVQLLVKINSALQPNKISFADYHQQNSINLG